MNKKAIWAIIGLMSAAVIGVVVLQMDLIRTAVHVNEERFEKNVYAALNAVVRRLEAEENLEVFNHSINGFMTTYYQEIQHSGEGAGNPGGEWPMNEGPSVLNPQINHSDLLDDLMRFTVDVTTLLVFGHDVDTLGGGRDVIQRHLERFFPTMLPAPSLTCERSESGSTTAGDRRASRRSRS